MVQMAGIKGSLKNGIHELLKILQELNVLKDLATDESSRKDYEIYVRDVQEFLEKASSNTVSLEEIQVYIDDYQGVVEYGIADGINNLTRNTTTAL